MSVRANQAQRSASDPATSVFVTANAGSGKTKVLVDRIARLLLEGSRPSSFLCVTYTKAAAAEMQRRLFQRLGAWCVADDASLSVELRALAGDDAPEPSRAQLGRARALFAQALETPGGLKIQTIHAFCERLLARFPLEAGVAPGFDIADEQRASALLARARADSVINADDDVSAAFSRFAEQLHERALESFLNRLALRRGSFRAYAERHGGQAFAQAALKNRHGARLGSDDFVAAFVQGLDWPGLEQAATVLRGSSAADQATAARISAAAALKRAGWPMRAVAQGAIGIAFKDDGKPYKALVTKALAKQHTWLANFLDRLSEAAASANAKLIAINRFEDAQAALALAARLDGAYERTKLNAGVLDFDDLVTHARALLARAEAAPWVLYKLDGGLDHILIDEGQDTSPAQWDLLSPLMDEFFAGKGARERPRTVFAVGDPKQSIYAFQGADPKRFLAESQTLSKRAHRAKQGFVGPMLETSFRSSPEILRAADAVFAGRDLAPGAPEKFNEVRHKAARAKEGGVVEVWPVAPRPPVKPSEAWDAPFDIETGASVHALTARAIARQARSWVEAGEAVWDQGRLRAMRPGDILTLVRTRGALFHELIKAYKREGFPVAGADRMVLRDELAVEDCLALARVALDPADDLALACVLKGPWCNLDDDDRHIFPLAYGRAKGETLFARLMACDLTEFQSARDFVNELVARAGEDAFAFLSWALETPHGDGPTGWARVLARLGAEARDPLEELLQRALKPSAHAAPSLQRFVHDIELDAAQVKRELEGASEATRVMTVHGAKGLEAPVVILPDATAPIADKPEDGLMFGADGAPFVSFRNRDDDDAVAAARAAYKDQMRGEHWRLLYVAMTRARDRLVVCGAQHGNASAGEAQDSWRLAVEQALQRIGASPCETPFGAGLRLGEVCKADAQASPIQPPHPALPSWTSRKAEMSDATRDAAPSRQKLANNALLSPRGDGQRRFRRGRLIHGLLERMPDVDSSRREAAARIWLQRQGVGAEEAAALTQEALAVVADTRFAALFMPSSRAEAPIVGAAGGRTVRGVVDRLAIDEQEVLVLDYKTDRPAPASAEDTPDAYVTQMALYRHVLSQIFAAKAVRCALLWTEAPRLVELPAPQLDDALARFLHG